MRDPMPTILYVLLAVILLLVILALLGVLHLPAS